MSQEFSLIDDGREWGIPPDHRVHEDQVFTQAAVPQLWHIPKSVFQPIWDSGITGKGVKIAINDTGVNPHQNLPTPIASRNFTNSSGGGNVDRNSHGCIAPDDIIYTSNCGLQCIKTFFDRMDGVAHFLEDKSIIKDISRYNIHTVSLDVEGKTPKAVRNKITHVHKLPHKGEIYKVEVDGAELSLTPWHPVYCISSCRGKEKTVIQKRADELVVGDKICTIPKSDDLTISEDILSIPIAKVWSCNNCSRESFVNVKKCKKCHKTNSYEFVKDVIYHLDESIAFLAGLIISDGYITKNSARKYVGFHSDNRELIELFCDKFEEVFSMRPFDLKKRNNCFGVRSGCVQAWDLFQKIGIPKGDKSKSCDLPELIAKSPRNIIESFVAGVIEGDGSVSSDKTRIVTASDEFASKLVLLLRSLGIRSSKSLCETDKTTFGPSRTWHVNVGSWIGMENKLVFRVPRTKKAFGRYCTAIKSIVKEQYDGFMYDFTVENSHNYVANGLVVSNTHCAGTALGRDGLGAAPEADLIATKVLSDGGSGATTWINSGRVWASEQGADIISESLGGGGSGQPDIASIQKAYENGVSICVAAAGNSGYSGRNTIGYPGKYMETCCVGAYRSDGSIATFSSGGREIDVATPGQQIISASYRGGYVAMSGTSMATPMWAGLMALIIHKRRITGFPDLKGMDQWRDFYVNQGFMDDAGSPGKDVRYGLGKPLIVNILEWLKEPLNV